MRVNTESGSTIAVTEPATLERVRLDCSLPPRRALDAVRHEELPFALTGSWAGGGAIIGACPVALAGGDPFATLDALPPVSWGRRHEDPVGGGWFGWLGYRLASLVERVPAGPPRPVQMPDYHLAYYDHVLRLDRRGRWWFEALVTPGRGSAIAARLRRLRALLDAAESSHTPIPVTPPLPLTISTEAADEHREAVRICGRRIHAGEIFQANICLRLESEWEGTASELFATALHSVSPSYGATFDTPRGGIASLSPELFLRRREDHVVTAPIKGTVPRPDAPGPAAAALAALRRSAKDAAEHVMIVDLMRNDIGRVCTYGSVQAPREPTAEPHPGVWHLVTRVHGRLRPGVGNADLLRATFPPGSVTGAPKVQSLQVIAELESSGREVYTGAIGFASPLAGLELSVAIRTLELAHGRLWLGAGGGIVADSDPQRELEEALTKARPIAAAVGTAAVVKQADARPSLEHALHAV